jgi:hypothetical protein
VSAACRVAVSTAVPAPKLKPFDSAGAVEGGGRSAAGTAWSVARSSTTGAGWSARGATDGSWSGEELPIDSRPVPLAGGWGGVHTSLVVGRWARGAAERLDVGAPGVVDDCCSTTCWNRGRGRSTAGAGAGSWGVDGKAAAVSGAGVTKGSGMGSGAGAEGTDEGAKGAAGGASDRG